MVPPEGGFYSWFGGRTFSYMDAGNMWLGGVYLYLQYYLGSCLSEGLIKIV